MCWSYCEICEIELIRNLYGARVEGGWRTSWRALYSIEGKTYLSEPCTAADQDPNFSSYYHSAHTVFSRISEAVLPKSHQSYFEKNHRNISFFHSACWDHLPRFFGKSLDLKELLEVLAIARYKRVFTSCKTRETWTPFFPKDELFKSRDYFSLCSALIERRKGVMRIPTENHWQEDPFARLPIETKLEIAEYLQVNDYLNLRLVSRAMFSIFDSPAFWRSRFYVNSDRGFLHFILTKPGDEVNWEPITSQDWYKIYRQATPHRTMQYPLRCPSFQSPTTQSRSSDESPETILAHDQWILTRQSVWNQMKWLQAHLNYNNMMARTRIVNEVPEFELDLMHSNTFTCYIRWQTMGAGLYNLRKHNDFKFSMSTQASTRLHTICCDAYFACPLLLEVQRLFLHESVTQIGIWVVSLDTNETYITGLELISNDDTIPNGTMGHRNPNSKLLIVDIESANQLRGFRIFATQDHISGIQLFTGDPAQVSPGKEMELNSSEWVGSAPASQSSYGCFNRMCTGKKIIALGATFDGWKMNGFQIGVQHTRKERSTESQRLRGKRNAAKRKRST